MPVSTKEFLISTKMKLIRKELLKQGKVTQLIKLDPSAEQRLLNEIKVMEGLLDNPEKGDLAQRRLTRIVYQYMNAFFENCRQNPEDFIHLVLEINQHLE